MWPLLIPAITEILGKILPDPKQAAAAQLEALKLAQSGALAELEAVKALNLAQAEVNKAEASSNAYTAGWRPTVGYVIAAALAFQYLLNPLLLWAAAFKGVNIHTPTIGLDDHLWELVMGMLGLAGWRSLDKIKGASP
jgi:hypothetical protein